MTTLISDNWVRRALFVTRPINPDWFHPGKRTRRSDIDAALALCALCPVRGHCLQNAIDNNDPWGIWGGTREEQRAVMLRTHHNRPTATQASAPDVRRAAHACSFGDRLQDLAQVLTAAGRLDGREPVHGAVVGVWHGVPVAVLGLLGAGVPARVAKSPTGVPRSSRMGTVRIEEVMKAQAAREPGDAVDQRLPHVAPEVAAIQWAPVGVRECQCVRPATEQLL